MYQSTLLFDEMLYLIFRSVMYQNSRNEKEKPLVYSSVLKYRGHHSPASLFLNEESFFNTLQNRSHLIDPHLVSSMEIIALP